MIHFDPLNKALGEEFTITWDEHLSKYDGLKTNQKLFLLSKERCSRKENTMKLSI